MRKETFVTGEYYHLYNRGVDKRAIFLDEADYQRFQSLLYLCNSGSPIHRSDYHRKNVDGYFQIEKEGQLTNIGAYALMPNHFHLLVHESSEQGLSTFLQKLCTSYSMYFNKKYGRTGSLFEGPYKAKRAEGDRYLKYLYAYIHLNPLTDSSKNIPLSRNKLREKLIEFSYTSMPDYLNKKRIQSKILTPSAFPLYFEKPEEHLTELNDWLSRNESENE